FSVQAAFPVSVWDAARDLARQFDAQARTDAVHCRITVQVVDAQAAGPQRLRRNGRVAAADLVEINVKNPREAVYQIDFAVPAAQPAHEPLAAGRVVNGEPVLYEQFAAVIQK